MIIKLSCFLKKLKIIQLDRVSLKTYFTIKLLLVCSNLPIVLLERLETQKCPVKPTFGVIVLLDIRPTRQNRLWRSGGKMGPQIDGSF